MSDYPTVLSSAEVKARFGSFSWKPNGSSAIIIDPAWTEANIVTVTIPQLAGVPTYGGTFNGRVRFHRLGIEQLQHAFADIEAAGYLKDIIFWDGSFVPRRMRGSQELSRHSQGTALDLNAEWNGFRQTPAKPGAKGSLWRVAPIFEKHGFAWGGRWSSPDGMHFEIAESRDYSEREEIADGKLVVNDDWKKAIPLWLEDGTAYANIDDLEEVVGEDDGIVESQRVPVAQFLRSYGFSVKWDGSAKKVYAYKKA
jgi:hypothetical protein